MIFLQGDPRWFALNKLWLGAQAKRNPLKRPKEITRGNVLLDAITEAMPHYSFGDEFTEPLPAELEPFFNEWRSSRACRTSFRRPMDRLTTDPNLSPTLELGTL